MSPRGKPAGIPFTGWLSLHPYFNILLAMSSFRNLFTPLNAAVAFLAAALTPVASAAEPTEKLRVFYIGNSVTDTINYDGLAGLARSVGVEYTWGRHMIPGAPLGFIWKTPEKGFKKDPFGAAREALANHAWDVVSIQPFDRKLDGKPGEGDAEVCTLIIRAALEKNPKTRFLLFSRWPRMRKDGKAFTYDANDYDPAKAGARPELDTIESYSDFWVKPYTGGWDGTNETREYFKLLADQLKAAVPEAAAQIEIVPVGETLFKLDQRMRAGEIPGFTTIHQFYKDTIHLNRYGSYTTALVYFATIHRKSPVGLPTAPYGDFDPAIVKILQEVVAEVTGTSG